MPSSSSSSTDVGDQDPGSPGLPLAADSMSSAPFAPGQNVLPSTARRKKSMQRSASSPNVRSLAASESGNASSSDKGRRNKLGYHRTTVACGHCRRRKIRCILALDDPNSRCQNCIRLKKECFFFPVDQQALFAKRPRSGSKVEGALNDPDSVSSSSPGLGVPGQEISDDSQAGLLESLHASQDGSYYVGGSIMSPNDHRLHPGRSQDLSSDQDDHSLHSTPFLNQSPQPPNTAGFEPPSSFWPAREHPLARNYTGFSVPRSATLPLSHDSIPQFPVPIAEYGWPQPDPTIRSMSVSGYPGMQDHYQPPFYGDSYPLLRRSLTSMSDVPHPSQNQHLIFGQPDSQPQPNPGNIPYEEIDHQSQMHGQGYAVPWATLPTQIPPGMANPVQLGGGQGLYAEPPPFVDVREEDYDHPSHPP